MSYVTGYAGIKYCNRKSAEGWKPLTLKSSSLVCQFAGCSDDKTCTSPNRNGWLWIIDSRQSRYVVNNYSMIIEISTTKRWLKLDMIPVYNLSPNLNNIPYMYDT